jgi:hypothetical protein
LPVLFFVPAIFTSVHKIQHIGEKLPLFSPVFPNLPKKNEKQPRTGRGLKRLPVRDLKRCYLID